MATVKQGVWNAETIRKARKMRGLTQAELAEALGCRQQTISEWELGLYTPKNAYQKLLAMFFGSTPVVSEQVNQPVWGEDNKTQEANNSQPSNSQPASEPTINPAIDPILDRGNNL